MASRSPVLPHERAPTQQIYAAQAAAARRKRRRVRRLAHEKEKQRQQGEQPSAHDHDLRRHVETSYITQQPGKRARWLELVQPDVEGIQDVANQLSRGQSVAVPTECTYELIRQHSAGPSPPLFAPTAAARIMEGALGNHNKTTTTTPHVYVTDISMLETSSFWKQLLPKKSYAIKNTMSPAATLPPRRSRSNSMVSPATLNRCDSRTLLLADSPQQQQHQLSTIATFNETIQVIRRIAPKVWPGPVLLYVQVAQPVAGLTVTVCHSGEQCYTSESSVQHYIALRMPCHPLTVRVCQEYYHQQQPTSPPASPAARPKSPPSVTSSPCLSRSGSSSSVLSMLSSAQILLGYPMLDDHDNKSGSAAAFVTTAAQVSDTDTTLVLNGEQRREIFSVPTCEHGQPCQVALWMDAERRTIRVQQPTPHHPSSTSAGDRQSPDTVMTSSGSKTGAAVVSESALLQSLRGTTIKPKNAVDRVIQAVLLKWKMVDRP